MVEVPVPHSPDDGIAGKQALADKMPDFALVGVAERLSADSWRAEEDELAGA